MRFVDYQKDARVSKAMKFVNYQKGLNVSKAIAGSSDRGGRIVSPTKVGVTLSDRPFKVPGSEAWYAMVLWNYSTNPEQISLNVLVASTEVAEVAG